MDKHSFPEEIKEFSLAVLAKLEAETRRMDYLHTNTSHRFPKAAARKEKKQLDRLTVKLPSLTDLLVALAPLPTHSVIVGACDDNLPVILELTNPEPGAVLLVGDPGSGKTQLMKSILNSACAISPPRMLRFCTIYSRPEQHAHWSVYPHCYRSAAVQEKSALDILQEMVHTAEQRCFGRGTRNPIILVIDDLSDLCKSLNSDELNLLLWLVQNGAQSQVWTFATFDPRKSEWVKPAVFNSFKTWLMGHTDPIQAGPYIPHETLQSTQNLMAGAQFSAYFENVWVPFWIPLS